MKVSIIIPYKDKSKELYLKECIDSANNIVFNGSYEVLECSGGTLSKNVNKGLKIANGEYIKVLSSDDMLTPNSIQDLYDGIGDCDWCYSKATNRFTDRNEIYQSYCHGLESMLERNTIHGGTTFYRRDVLLKIGGYNDDLWTGEEYDLHLRLLKEGYNYRYINTNSYIYRIHEGQKSVYGSHSDCYLSKRKKEIERIRSLYR